MHLGDLPAGISGQRLARGVLFGTALRLGAALTLTAGLVAANAAHKLPGLHLSLMAPDTHDV